MSEPAHVVLACVIERDGKFLLVEERVNGALVLNQPAGHWEPGETVFEGAVREALEETGWYVKLTSFLGIYEYQPEGLPYTFLRIAFVASAISQRAGHKLDEGIERAVWMTRDEVVAAAARHRSPMLLRCIDDYLAGRRLPLDIIAHLTPKK